MPIFGPSSKAELDFLLITDCSRHDNHSNFEELEGFLRTWRSWVGDEYDFGGMVALLGACLENIERHAIDGDLEDFADRLDPEQQRTLFKLAALVRNR